MGKVPLFSQLSKEQLEALSRRMKPARFESGEQIFAERQPADQLYLVKSGWVELRTGSSSEGVTLANLGPGSLVGGADALLDRAHPTSAVAASDVEVWAVGASDLEEMVARDPDLGMGMSRALGARVIGIGRHIAEQYLEGLPFLAGLQPGELLAMAGNMQPASYQKGDLIVGAGDPKAGACGSVYNIVEENRLNHRVQVDRGILASECSELLRDFFAAQRAQGKK